MKETLSGIRHLPVAVQELISELAETASNASALGETD
jgi:hypothetical protein